MSDLAAKGSAIEEERTGNIDPKVIQKLLKADDIKAALDDYDKQVALFTKWMADEMTTSAILGKLSEKDKIIENMPILAKFNDFRMAVELKNDVALMGVLDSVDQYLNIKLLNVSVVEGDKFPQLMNMKNCFIRGSSIRYVQIPAGEVDTELLQDAARREATANKQS
ncbi:hypothetical protein PInf_021781 [Phytophthora infestans]|nr:hypothetical protein PInf_021781 [Phytophthora infestans]